jgi:hypothetical protein
VPPFWGFPTRGEWGVNCDRQKRAPPSRLEPMSWDEAWDRTRRRELMPAIGSRKQARIGSGARQLGHDKSESSPWRGGTKGAPPKPRGMESGLGRAGSRYPEDAGGWG